MIAMAVSCGPRLLLCDEPTTALDVTVQLQVLRLLEKLCQDSGTALVFVTHDLAVVNQTCSELAVMYAGHIVESGRVEDTFRRPRHPTPAACSSRPRTSTGPTGSSCPSRLPAERLRPAAGLPVRAALRVRPAALHAGGAAARRGRAGPAGRCFESDRLTEVPA